jgi:DNA repair protein RadC
MKLYKSKIDFYKLIKKPSDIPKVKITSSLEIFEYSKKYIFSEIDVCEYFYIVCLNRANNTIGYHMISKGGTTGTIVDPLILSKIVVDSLAQSIILLHNHPSGNSRPSNEDIKLTTKIKNCLNIFNVTILDHLIITNNKYYSFADEGILNI